MCGKTSGATLCEGGVAGQYGTMPVIGEIPILLPARDPTAGSAHRQPTGALIPRTLQIAAVSGPNPQRCPASEVPSPPAQRIRRHPKALMPFPSVLALETFVHSLFKNSPFDAANNARAGS